MRQREGGGWQAFRSVNLFLGEEMKQRLINAAFLACIGAALISMTMGAVDREVRKVCFVAAAVILIEGWATWYITTHDEHGRAVYTAKGFIFVSPEMKWRLFNAGLLAWFVVSLWLLTMAAVDREVRVFCFAAAALMLIEGSALWYISTYDKYGRPLRPAKCLLDEF